MNFFEFYIAKKKIDSVCYTSYSIKMQVAGFLVFLMTYMQIYPLNAEPEHRVSVMNDMFTHVGWIEWPDKRKAEIDYVFIIDHWMENKITDVSELLGPSDDGPIVTNDNVDHKMIQAHQFLSCKYATVLIKFCEYERGIGPACMRMKNTSESLYCLKKLMEMLEKSEPLVMCMRGSLMCLYDLSPQTPFEKQLFEILENLIDYYGNIQFDEDSIIAGGNDTITYTVAAMTASVEKQISETLELLNAFYDHFCWIIGHDKLSRHQKLVQTYLNSYDPVGIMTNLRTHIQQTINPFMESFNGRFGFKYNFDSKKTILMYDPNLLQRIEIMNKLLEKPGWTALERLEIITPNGYITFLEFITASADGNLVTKANADEKVQQTHHFLNCYYAITLERCIDYVILLWKQYNKSKHLPDSSDLRTQFVDTVMISKPLVSNMLEALSRIFQLGPHITYSIDFSNILLDFKNYFHDTIENEIIQGNLNIENDMWNIVQRLEKPFNKKCFPDRMFNKNKFLKESAKLTFSSLKNKFLDEIANFVLSNYEHLGFPF
ncbi:uncharacterized protein LOC126839905 isoform X2 [Adelges cooleyi]|uniref:uncharacterized protein LOC126839905 isoform X2 n=1 Tax=Adelges cooleyi TaxID=133065 RepID=UPI00217F84BC|nr:uncharacterized protein LOC126839905 isoform X2 [Adelges cooleyi]